jgi:pimeloyl-ACP methyl ester carboxylesterase
VGKFPRAGSIPVRRIRRKPRECGAFFVPGTGPPRARELVSRFVVAGADRTINPHTERGAAERMGATMVEIEGGSHSIAVSRSEEVTAVILQAVEAVTAQLETAATS